MTGLLNSSVNLTWGFSDGFNGNDEVRWGLKQDGINMFINNGELVILDPSGNSRSIPNIPTDYKGRVSGRLTGNKVSGQAIFTLSSIRKSDERFYGCEINPLTGFDDIYFDHVYLFVAGKYFFLVFLVTQRHDQL